MYIFLITSAPILLILSSKSTLFILLYGTGVAPSKFSSFYGSVCRGPWKECKATARGRDVPPSGQSAFLVYHSTSTLVCKSPDGVYSLQWPVRPDSSLPFPLGKHLSHLSGHSYRPVLVHIFQKISSHQQLYREGRQSGLSSFLVHFSSTWRWYLLSSLVTSMPLESFLTSVIS